MANKTTTLQIDNHEPSRLVDLIAPTVPYVVTDLNNRGYADFLWESQEGPRHLERKTWENLLSGVGAIEEQLHRQIEAHRDTRLMLLVEGIVVPIVDPIGGTGVLHQTAGNPRLYYQSTSSKVSLTALFAWIYQVSKYVEVFTTPDIETTARAIVAFFSSDQKENHQTFRRYLKEVTFHPNPQVTSLMGMLPGLGPVKSESLIGRFGTVWEVLKASPMQLAEVRGIGVKEATKWLRLIGRPDV